MSCSIYKLFALDKKGILFILMTVSWIFAFVLYVITSDNSNCQSLFERGRLSSQNKWQPSGCMLHQYVKSDVDWCARELNELHIDIVGDSRLRQVYERLATVVTGESVKTGKAHSDLQCSSNHSATFVNFFWYPRVNDAMLALYELWITSKRRVPAVLVTGSATWTIKQLNASDEAANSFRGNLSKIAPVLKQLSQQTRVVWMMQDPVVESKLNPSRVMITNQQIDLYNSIAAETLKGVVTFWQSSRQVALGLPQDTEDGLHRGTLTMEQDVIMLFNMLCNDVIPVPDGTCCRPADSVTWPTLLLGVFFMACALATLTLWLRQGGCCSVDTLATDKNSNAVSVLELLVSLSLSGLVMGYVYICDRTIIFGKENKHYSWPAFLGPVVSIVVMCVWRTAPVDTTSAQVEESSNHNRNSSDHEAMFDAASQVDSRTTRQCDVEASGCNEHIPSPAADLIPRPQTEEWKGWMQLVILVYHMTGASQDLAVYMHIRILVSAYLFITGFVQFESVFKKGCPSARKIGETVLKYNLLAMVLCVLMNRPYQSYYFVPLVTFHYLLVIGTLAVPPQLTLACDMTSHKPYLLTYGKLCLLFVILTVFANSESLFKAVFGNGLMAPLFVTANKSLHEWHFRWTIDRYSSLFGVTCACVWRHLHTGTGGKPSRLVCVCLSCFGLLSYSLLLSTCQSKAQCNEFHPYITCVPIISFLYLRNCVPVLRSCHSVLAAYCGRISLELFLVQYHIWLAADTHGVLVLVTHSPLLNLVVISVILVLVADNINLITKHIYSTLNVKAKQPMDLLHACILVCIVVLTCLVYGQGLL